MELAEWRKNHHSDWALECSMKSDPDPLAWFAAFESWIKWVRATHLSKMAANTGTFALGAPVVGEEINLGEGADTSQEVQLRLPGSYPLEEEEQC